jgi:hypothetical protein
MISALQRVVPKAVFVSTGPADDYIKRTAQTGWVRRMTITGNGCPSSRMPSSW